jgi:Helix-turn-helix domain
MQIDQKSDGINVVIVEEANMIPGFENLTYYEILDVSPGVEQKEIQEGYYRVREAFGKNALASYSLYSDDEREIILQLAEEAYHVLIEPKAREEYDKSMSEILNEIRKSKKYVQEGLPLTPGYMMEPESYEKKIVEEKTSPLVEEVTEVSRPENDEDAQHSEMVLEGPADDIKSDLDKAPQEDEKEPDKKDEIEEHRTSSKDDEGSEQKAASPPSQNSAAEWKISDILGDEEIINAEAQVKEKDELKRNDDEETIADDSLSKTQRPDDVDESAGGDKELFEETVYDLPEGKQKKISPLDYIESGVSGSFLKEVRQRQEKSLKTVWEVTKIRRPILLAIEEEDHKNLPADVFLKGMLLIYARYLEMEDPESVVKGYMERILATRDWMD